jgi:hypothetical protein
VVDVVLLVEDQVVAAAAANEPAPIAPEQRRDKPAITTTTTPQIETAATLEPGTEPTVRNKFFDMRAGKQPTVDLQLRRDFRDDLEHAPEGTAPQVAVVETGKLQPNGGGTYRSNEGVFTAKVERDGSVNLKDAKNLRISWPDPRKLPKLPKMIGRGVADWYAQENKTPGDPEREQLNIHRAPNKETKPDHGQTGVPVVGGSFDVTDAFMRGKKIDPYASRKLAYLDSTRDERVQIGKRYRQQQLKQSPQIMQKNLEHMWATTQDLTARKQALFELWDECAETGEDSVIEGGRAARRLVVGFIRARLPAGTEHAFTSPELATLNGKRHSKAAFAPYE